MTNVVLFTSEKIDIDKVTKFTTPGFTPICVGSSPDTTFVYGTYDTNRPEDMAIVNKTGTMKNGDAFDYLLTKMSMTLEFQKLIPVFEKYTGDKKSDIQVEGIGKWPFIGAIKGWVEWMNEKGRTDGHTSCRQCYFKLV